MAMTHFLFIIQDIITTTITKRLLCIGFLIAMIECITINRTEHVMDTSVFHMQILSIPITQPLDKTYIIVVQ